MEIFDIILVEFVFREDENSYKYRPAMLVNDFDVFQLAQITSHSKRVSTDYEIKNWKEAGLDKPSTILFNKKKLINKKESILDISKSGNGVYIGHLTVEDINKLKELKLVENLIEDIEKHDELNFKLFDGEELKPEIKDKIEQIAYQFIRELAEDGIKFDLKDIVLLGSNISYNYTKDSDLDIHLIADSTALECPQELQDKLYGAYRNLFNKNYDIRIKGIPAEIYVELDEPRAKSNGIYSINNGWLKKPVQQDIPDLDKESFDKAFKEWEDRYNELINDKEATSEDVVNYINDIYEVRKDGIANDGEYSQGNLIFKELRNKGYLDNLKELRKELKGKELSLEQLDKDSTKNYNKVEVEDMRENKRVKRPVKEATKVDMLKKYPNAYIPEIDSKTGLPILPDEFFGDWEY